MSAYARQPSDALACEEIDYPALAMAYDAYLADGGLLMCHPGLPGPEPAAMARGAELRYLESDRFLSDCAEAGVSLVRPQEASA